MSTAARVKELLAKFQPAQRSPEWYAIRNTSVSASEVSSLLTCTPQVVGPYNEQFGTNVPANGKCCSAFKSKSDFILDKCKASLGISTFQDSIFTLWGKKYEQAATRLYCQLRGVKVLEFGSLASDTYTWLRASPDGITPEGVMLEIKCPFSRKINGKVPLSYWQQMQIQLHTAGLSECDYLECEIRDVAKQEWLDFENARVVGVLVEHDEKFIYPDENIDTHEGYLQFIQGTPGKPWYYIITKYNIVNVRACPEWIEHVVPILKEAHETFTRLQEDPELCKSYIQDRFNEKNKGYFEKQKADCEIKDFYI